MNEEGSKKVLPSRQQNEVKDYEEQQALLMDAAQTWGPYVWEHSSDIINALLWFSKGIDSFDGRSNGVKGDVNDSEKCLQRRFLSSVLESKGIFSRKRSYSEAFGSNTNCSDNNECSNRDLSLLYGVLEGYKMIGGDFALSKSSSSAISYKSLTYLPPWLSCFAVDLLGTIEQFSKICDLLQIYDGLCRMESFNNTSDNERDGLYWQSADTRISMLYASNIVDQVLCSHNIIPQERNIKSRDKPSHHYVLDKLGQLALYDAHIRSIFVMVVLQTKRRMVDAGLETSKSTLNDIEREVVESLKNIANTVDSLESSYANADDSFFFSIPTPLMHAMCSSYSELADFSYMHLLRFAIKAFVSFPKNITKAILEKTTSPYLALNDVFFNVNKKLKTLADKDEKLKRDIGKCFQKITEDISGKYFEAEEESNRVQLSKEVIACKEIALNLGFEILF